MKVIFSLPIRCPFNLNRWIKLMKGNWREFRYFNIDFSFSLSCNVALAVTKIVLSLRSQSGVLFTTYSSRNSGFYNFRALTYRIIWDRIFSQAKYDFFCQPGTRFPTVLLYTSCLVVNELVLNLNKNTASGDLPTKCITHLDKFNLIGMVLRLKPIFANYPTTKMLTS